MKYSIGVVQYYIVEIIFIILFYFKYYFVFFFNSDAGYLLPFTATFHCNHTAHPPRRGRIAPLMCQFSGQEITCGLFDLHRRNNPPVAFKAFFAVTHNIDFRAFLQPPRMYSFAETILPTIL